MSDAGNVGASLPGSKAGLGATRRTDPWWAEWLGVVVGLGVLAIYATWAAFQGGHYEWGPYLSPFYSPKFLLLRPGHAPHFVPLSVIALTVILAFRGTCYYYRKAYYRAFFAVPPSCAVGEARDAYSGETRWPFLIQNFHRYFMFLALIALLFLWVDVITSFWYLGAFHVGLGTVIMLINVGLLSGYTLGCHSLRHIFGGKSNCFSCAPAQAKAWKTLTGFNAKHMQWAWASLVWVCVTDLYIRLLAMYNVPVGGLW